MAKSSKKTKKIKKQKKFLVKWGGYDDDPVEEFDNLESAKERVKELIREDEDLSLEDITIFIVLSKLRPVSDEIIFKEI